MENLPAISKISPQHYIKQGFQSTNLVFGTLELMFLRCFLKCLKSFLKIKLKEITKNKLQPYFHHFYIHKSCGGPPFCFYRHWRSQEGGGRRLGRRPTHSQNYTTIYWFLSYKTIQMYVFNAPPPTRINPGYAPVSSC